MDGCSSPSAWRWLNSAQLTSERTSENLLARSTRTEETAGGQLLGYDIDPEKKGRMVPNEAENAGQPHLRQVFGTGLCPRRSRWLNKAGYRTKGFTDKTSGKVHKHINSRKQTVHWVLNNRAYLGGVGNQSDDEGQGSEEPARRNDTRQPRRSGPRLFPKKFAQVYSLMRQNGQIRKNSTAKVSQLHPARRGSMRDLRILAGRWLGDLEFGDLHFYYRHRGTERQKGASCPPYEAETLEKVTLGRLNYLAERQDIIAVIAEEATATWNSGSPKVMGLLGSASANSLAWPASWTSALKKVLELSDSKTIKELIEPHAEELKQQREKVSGGNRTAPEGLDELKGNGISD